MSSFSSKQDDLSGSLKIAAVVVVVCLGLWGCARKPAVKVGGADRVRELERKCVAMEQNYRAAQESRDKAKKDLGTMEEETERLQKELSNHNEVVKERDALRKLVKANQTERDALRQTLAQRTSERDDARQQIAVRSSERDALQVRCDRLRKGLQSILSQEEVSISPAPASTPVSTTLSGQS